jgi:hypothetical protein
MIEWDMLEVSEIDDIIKKLKEVRASKMGQPELHPSVLNNSQS